MELEELVLWAGRGMEAAGVAVIVLGAAAATVGFAARSLRGRGAAVGASYPAYRRDLGRAILLGLEFLVAGDIIRSVAVDPSFEGVGILAIIVVIRTFLSFTLELEIDGRWPWQRDDGAGRRAPGAGAG